MCISVDSCVLSDSLLCTGGITKRENEVKSIALVFSELRKGMER